MVDEQAEVAFIVITCLHLLPHFSSKANFRSLVRSHDIMIYDTYFHV